jgi:hypothetical protein
MFLEASRKLFILVSLLYVSTASSPVTVAQDLIRVETNQVLVPVIVVDKDRWRLVWNDPNLLRAVKENNLKLEEEIVESVVIHHLTSVDFQIFDDGKDQEVKNVTYVQSPYSGFQDNKGYHTELLGEGGGKWSSAEWPSWQVGVPTYGNYVIAYALPESPEGSCHQIKVKVNRRDAFVLARKEYCNTKSSASDPLNGTMLGKQMESDLAWPRANKVGITLLAVAFYTETGAARVHVALDWAGKSLKRYSTTTAVLGMVFKKDGSRVMRFSDLEEYASWEENEAINGHYVDPDPSKIATRYETQLILPTGEYDLQVVLSDGTNFGRAEIPLTVDTYDRTGLAISNLALCKQIQDVSTYSPKSPVQLPGYRTTKLSGNYVPLVSKDVEFKPTSNTRFKKGETLYAYFEVYEPLLAGKSPPTVQIQMRVVDVKTGELKSDSQPISATSYLKAGSPVIPIGRGIDISKLPKGSYRLEVQATDSAGKNTAWRTANFTVE